MNVKQIGIEFYESFKKWMEGQSYSVNYIGDIFKHIKVFMNEAAERGIHNESGHKSKKFKIVTEESDTIYLSVDKLKKLYALEITPQTLLEFSKDALGKNLQLRIESLTSCRDRFLIGAFTALRFSDFNTIEGLKHTDEFITKRSQKTGTRTMIPMHPIIRDILQRRGDQLPTPVSNQKMNQSLHLLAQIAGLNEPVQATRTNGGKMITKTVPEWQMITTHTARRSGCTNMYLAGIPIRTIMNFSGHKTITSFMKYIKIEVMEDALKMKDHPFFN